MWALCSTPVVAQTGKSVVLTVRVAEENRHARLWINWPGREPELVEFDWNDKEGKGNNAGIGYEAALRKVYEQGYQLQGVLPGIARTDALLYTYSTLVFTKPQ